MLGAALGRKVWFNQDAHTLYPMLNTLLIGPSGIGKSTSVKIGKQLIDALPKEDRPQFIQGKATPEKLHDDLMVDPHTVIFASELANFFSRAKYMEDMIPYVTQLLDYEPQAERRTRGSDLLVVKNPSATIVGGSTVEWLQDQLPDSAATGGFLARFLIVKEDHKRQRVADARSMLSKTQWADVEKQRHECLGLFCNAVLNFKGEITYHNPLARDAYSIWYQTQTPMTGALSPFSARAGEFVLRLAMILAISCDRFSITEEDIDSGIRLYDYATAKLQEVVVPFSPQGRLLAKVYEAVGNSPMPDWAIKRALRNYASSQDVERMLQSLLMSKDIILSDGKYIRTRRRDA
jgi:energy-coupling factor transporter ATP-binding protein EcfA2